MKLDPTTEILKRYIYSTETITLL